MQVFGSAGSYYLIGHGESHADESESEHCLELHSGQLCFWALATFIGYVLEDSAVIQRPGRVLFPSYIDSS